MALTITTSGDGGRGILYGSTTTRTTYPTLPPPRHLVFPTFTTRTSHIVSAKKLSSRTGRFDSKNRRSTTTSKEEDEELQESTAEIESSSSYSSTTDCGGGVVNSDGVPLPVLPGDQPDFWEGTQWDGFGFFVQYMWAFGIAFAENLIACGIAVATYNEGATDFKDTSAYKESIQSSNILEEPEASNSDVFESNPTEEAPSLE